ncbi:hypothetical protein ACQEU5_25265 [Marinactinospora thermotolerans]|uniref:hypothetical protein n=1 Tax=Marinactinospora thermotolerans TaxID=531310 RepID=UPI003D8A1601
MQREIYVVLTDHAEIQAALSSEEEAVAYAAAHRDRHGGTAVVEPVPLYATARDALAG